MAGNGFQEIVEGAEKANGIHEEEIPRKHAEDGYPRAARCVGISLVFVNLSFGISLGVSTVLMVREMKRSVIFCRKEDGYTSEFSKNAVHAFVGMEQVMRAFV